MADDLDREVRRLRDRASEQFDRLLAHSRDYPVEDLARDLFELAESLRQASCSRAVLDAPIEHSTTGAAMGKSLMRSAIEHMPLDSLTYHLGYHVARFDEMRLYWYRVKAHVWSAFAEDASELTFKEQCIVDSLGKDELTGQEIADKSGYPFNSRLRQTLADMVKNGSLVKGKSGQRYRKP